MRGFLCHSEVSIAVCLSCDSRKVVVPVARRRMPMEEHAKLINKCSSRLGDVACRLDSVPISRRSRNIVVVVNSSVLTIFKRGKKNCSKIVPSLSFQVVVMSVSLYCQGYAGKVKKHLSKLKEKTELILQKTLNYGETLNGGARLDIDAEKKVAMRVLGIRRARIHEWTNTYSFRKARERCSWDTSRRMFNS
ncbi:hypothetical protein P3L10_013746 [Capsicum annuum]